MTHYRFPKRARLLRGHEFDRVFAARASAGDGLVVVYGAASGLDHPRLGLAVSRRTGSAVARNRWKRVLREAFRLTQGQLPALDLVCVPRAGAVPEFHRLVESLPALAARIDQKLHQRNQSAGSNPQANAKQQAAAQPQANAEL